MRTPASIAGHPIHPMLVPLPIGLWVFSLVCDIAAFTGGDAPWRTVAFYTMAGGLVGALAAALPGLVDLLSLPPGPKRTAVVHMSINLTVVALFAVNLWLRVTDRAGTLTLALSVVGVGLLAVSGWLGGKMVYIHRVAVVDDDPRAR